MTEICGHKSMTVSLCVSRKSCRSRTICTVTHYVIMSVATGNTPCHMTQGREAQGPVSLTVTPVMQERGWGERDCTRGPPSPPRDRWSHPRDTLSRLRDTSLSERDTPSHEHDTPSQLGGALPPAHDTPSPQCETL